jgi:hypothetical protein
MGFVAKREEERGIEPGPLLSTVCYVCPDLLALQVIVGGYLDGPRDQELEHGAQQERGRPNRLH